MRSDIAPHRRRSECAVARGFVAQSVTNAAAARRIACNGLPAKPFHALAPAPSRARALGNAQTEGAFRRETAGHGKGQEPRKAETQARFSRVPPARVRPKRKESPVSRRLFSFPSGEEDNALRGSSGRLVHWCGREVAGAGHRVVHGHRCAAARRIRALEVLREVEAGPLVFLTDA